MAFLLYDKENCSYGVDVVNKTKDLVATISQKGWVVIPKALRERYGFQPGAKVAFVEYGGMLALVPVPEDPVAAMYGMLADGPSLTEELLAEHRAEKIREQRLAGE